MATPEADKDNVTPFGIRETARLEFEPSEKLKQSMSEMFTDDYRITMGQKTLFLYSDFAQSVVRRKGVVIGQKGPIETEMNGIIHRAPPQPKLARYVNAERGRSVAGKVDVYILRLAVHLDTKTVHDIHQSQTISSRFLNGLTVPVRAVFPSDALKPIEARTQAIDWLIDLVLGGEDGDSLAVDLRAKAANPQAAVKNMQMVFRKLPNQ